MSNFCIIFSLDRERRRFPICRERTQQVPERRVEKAGQKDQSESKFKEAQRRGC